MQCIDDVQINPRGAWRGLFDFVPHGPLYRVQLRAPNADASILHRPLALSALERMLAAWGDEKNRAIGGESWWDVTVNLKNGSQLNTRVPGHGDTYGPYTNIQVIDKFQALAGTVISPSQVDTLLNLVMDLENQSDVMKIMDAATLGLAVKA